MEDNIELLSCALEGGCSAKIPPDLLEKTLAPILKLKTDSNLLSDVDIGDDAGVYKISEDSAIIFTVDFFSSRCSQSLFFRTNSGLQFYKRYLCNGRRA